MGQTVCHAIRLLNHLLPATGAHECVGFTGLALGGGHGRYEGKYGLASDNLISLNTVLADGSTIEVSETSHPDLFWGMKGAGHNYGIVTSLEVKVFPREVDMWHYHNYFWSGDKLETVFERANAFHGNGSTPVKMGVNYGSFTMNPKFSNTSVGRLALLTPSTSTRSLTFHRLQSGGHSLTLVPPTKPRRSSSRSTK